MISGPRPEADRGVEVHRIWPILVEIRHPEGDRAFVRGEKWFVKRDAPVDAQSWTRDLKQYKYKSFAIRREIGF